jgi:hypothetical protein
VRTGRRLGREPAGRATLEQIKSSGVLRQISNRALVEKISAYDALSWHLDLDYTNDRDKTSVATSTSSRK